MEHGLDAAYSGSDNRTDFKQIIAKRSDLVKYAGGRLRAADAPVTLYGGQLLAQIQSGPTAGRWTAYDHADNSGTGINVCRGVLAEKIDAEAGDDGTKLQVIVGGDLLKDNLVGDVANAIADLNARTYIEGGDNILSF